MILSNIENIVKGFFNIFQGKLKIFLSQKENKHAEALFVEKNIKNNYIKLNKD